MASSYGKYLLKDVKFITERYKFHLLISWIMPITAQIMPYNNSMINVSDDQFSDLIGQALDEMPADHMAAVENVAIVYADDPTPEQRMQLQLRHDQTLFGLYEGVPLAARQGMTSYGPDKITIFKNPIQYSVETLPQLKEAIKHTVWHELAHYFGLNHQQIHNLE